MLTNTLGLKSRLLKSCCASFQLCAVPTERQMRPEEQDDGNIVHVVTLQYGQRLEGLQQLCSQSCERLTQLPLNPPILTDTFAKRLRVVPVRIPRTDTLDDRGSLFQGVAGVTGELNHSSDTVQRVGGGEIAVLEVGLVAVAALERWGRKGNGRQRLVHFQDTAFVTTMTAFEHDCLCDTSV